MASSAPVVSPTAIICTTIGGKTFDSPSGSDTVRPSLILCRATMIAFSITTLPAVFDTMARPSRIGPPLLISVPSVRGRLVPLFDRKPDPDQGDADHPPVALGKVT